MRIEPEITGVSLVLLGDFNPPIFTPSWFGWQGLLSEEMVENAELEIAQRQIVVFRADWLELQVVPDRYSASSAQAPFVRLRDLTIRVFREQLPHTRLRALGINRDVHFLVNNYGERDKIGRTLAPTEPWGDWGQNLDPDGTAGGVASLTMTQRNPRGRPLGGQINVTVEPSTRVGDNERGIYVRVNDHYVVEDPEGLTASSEIISILEEHFEKSVRQSDEIIDHVMSLREG